MSLTGHLDDLDSPVRRHFEATYPHLDQVRFAATPGQATPRADRQSLAHTPASARWVARLCGLLALYEQLYRVPEASLARHPLLLAAPDASLKEQLDVAALTALLVERQPDLPAGGTQVISNPTFDRSDDLGGADADLVADGILLELKTAKTAALNKITVWQVLGYLLADTTDRYRIRGVGWYFARHGYLWHLPVEDFLARLRGAEVDLAVARAEFADVLSPHDRNTSTSEQTSDSGVNPTIERTVSFFPNASGRGRWHVARAQIVGADRWGDPAGPACGARSTLDLAGSPARPEVGQPWTQDERLCGNCLTYTGTSWAS